MKVVMTLPWLEQRSEIDILDLGSDSVLCGVIYDYVLVHTTMVHYESRPCNFQTYLFRYLSPSWQHTMVKIYLPYILPPQRIGLTAQHTCSILTSLLWTTLLEFTPPNESLHLCYEVGLGVGYEQCKISSHPVHVVVLNRPCRVVSPRILLL